MNKGIGKERWKWIKGFERRYKISNYGRVKSFCAGNGVIRKVGTFLRFSSSTGYNRVCFYPGGKLKNFKVARLVAQSFIPNPENKSEINHVDGVKTNDHYKNLEWVTKSENALHAHRVLGNTNGFTRENITWAKLNFEQAREIRKIYNEKNLTRYELAKIYGVSVHTIRSIVLNLTWRDNIANMSIEQVRKSPR